MKKSWKHLSYRMRVSMVMALFAIIPFSLFGVVYLKSEQNKWTASALKDYAQFLAVSSEKMDRGFQDMESKILYVRNNTDIRVYLSQIHKMSLREGLDFVGELHEVTNAVSADNKQLSVRWFSYFSERNYGGYCYPLEQLCNEFEKEDVLLDKILEMGNTEVFSTIRNLDRDNSNGKKTEQRACVYTKINNLNGSDSVLEISVPINDMVDISEVQLPEGSLMGAWLYLEDMHQMLMFSEGSEEEQQVMKEYFETGNCDGYYPLVQEIDGLPGSQLACLFKESYVSAASGDGIMNYILLMSLFILTVFGCSYMAARLLTDHVGHFIERINVELDENSLETMDAVIDKGDLQGIEKRIRKLIRDTQEYCARLDQYEAEKNRMELELLQMRFNPHFLYNTLASIRYQLKDSSIRKMIDSLIHYYRIVLSKGELFISIFSEMEMIKEYLELEIFSYCLENIAYELNVDEEVKDCNIIKHLLQPIVENALEHGVRASEKKGIIRIQAKPDGEDIVFVIEDNGIGMTGQQIENVMSGVGRENMDGGYGIYNVKQRIETYYGKEYGIDFYSVLNEGTRVTLRIPKQHAAHNTDID